MPTFLGLVSAGVAIALADVLKNLVGWGHIRARRPFQVGDRIEVDGTKGEADDKPTRSQEVGEKLGRCSSDISPSLVSPPYGDRHMC